MSEMSELDFCKGGLIYCPTCNRVSERRGTGWACLKCGVRFWIDDWENISRWNEEIIFKRIGAVPIITILLTLSNLAEDNV